MAQSKPIDTTIAHQYFQEAQTACTQDGGKFWGISLCGPILFVDPVTRTVITNQSDKEGLLTKKDNVFVGRLPNTQPVANAYITWAGVKWSMIVWIALTEDKFQRVKLIMHESYHRIQNDVKLPLTNSKNDHLDTREGRIWLQLEWRALRQALISKGVARRRAVEDALTFRKYRRSIFSNTDANENALEMHEGIAEYTAFKLTAKDNVELIDYLVKQLDKSVERPTFVASFAYSSGPAYGVLLDAVITNWHRTVTPETDMGDLLQKALGIKLSSDLKAKAEKQALKYDGAALRVAESEREEKRQKQIAEYRKRLVDGPRLLIELTNKRSVTLNSSNLVPLENFGTVYPTARVTDEWGILEISNGALMISDRGRIMKIYVSAPADLNARPVKGDGWTLELNEGWALVPGERTGDYILKRL
jgi:hypothetical protein